ncbi:MAG: hypothetical protein A2W00_09070 [Candidatus Eisenbacteria bacterium RBG_16_71_46]|nr:MAG: hypothetical protein A2W00_09070 [Candidatus Eisenbacteria bacterium RBG_16_71_46]
MSKFDLRDVSDRLTRSRDIEAVVSEFLGYLQAVRSDWYASLAFYEVSRDALVNLYVRDRKLSRRDIVVPVDQLPARLVRKFFHPSAFFNHADRRSLLANLFQSAPYYEPDAHEAHALQPLAPIAQWQSCICMPLVDEEDLLAMLVLVSVKRGAFTAKVLDEVVPIKNMAALAIAQRLHRAAGGGAEDGARAERAAVAEFQEHIRNLSTYADELETDNRAKTEKLNELAAQIHQFDQHSGRYREELLRVKATLLALEAQTSAATEQLSNAYSQLDSTQSQLDRMQSTLEFIREVFRMLADPHDPREFSGMLVEWFCEHFGVERCSLMLLDATRDALQIAAHRGIDPAVAGGVKVRVGQGIAGWVARNRRPLFVRVREENRVAPHTDQDVYNSDSFISVPLMHNNRLRGVLNLSNKVDGEHFDEMDLDRAVLAGSVLAIAIGDRDAAARETAAA